MRTTSLLLVILILSCAALTQTPASNASSPFDQQLIANQKQFLQAMMDKNATQLNQSVSDDFRGIQTNGDLYNRREIISSDEGNLPKDALSYSFQVVKLDDDCAVVSYNLIVPNEHPRYRHMADTWTKVGGQWKLKFRQITPNLWSAKDFD
jgi:hypothetical protein